MNELINDYSESQHTTEEFKSFILNDILKRSLKKTVNKIHMIHKITIKNFTGIINLKLLMENIIIKTYLK